jgi:hypothetical protein
LTTLGENGAEVEMIEHFPFMLSLSKHSELFQKTAERLRFTN